MKIVLAKEALRELRLKKGLTLSKFSELAGYTPSAMTKVETQRNGVNPERAQNILAVLSVEFDDVFQIIDKGVRG